MLPVTTSSMTMPGRSAVAAMSTCPYPTSPSGGVHGTKNPVWEMDAAEVLGSVAMAPATNPAADLRPSPLGAERGAAMPRAAATP